MSENSREPGGPTESGSLDETLAIPYMLDVSTRRSDNGDWVCRLEYPELPGCVAESRHALDAYELVEKLRENWLRDRLVSGGHIPTPRSPLRS